MLSLLFTTIVIQWSHHSGRLSHDPKADDVGYLLDGLERLHVTYEKGLLGLFENVIASPPHSMFSTFGAALAFAIAGPHDWAPYAFNGILIFSLLCLIVAVSTNLQLSQIVLTMLFVLSLPVAVLTVHDFRPDCAAAIASSTGICFAAASIQCSPPFSSKKYLLFIGTSFAIAFLIKPTLLVISFSLFIAVIAIIAIIHFWYHQGGPNKEETLSLSYKLLLICSPPLLFSGWYYLIAYKQLYEYVYVNSIGQYAHLWKMPGGLIDSIKYFAYTAPLALLGSGAISSIFFVCLGFCFALIKRDRQHMLSQVFVFFLLVVVLVILATAKYNNLFFASFQVFILITCTIMSIIYLYQKLTYRLGYVILNLLIVCSILAHFVVNRPTIVRPVNTSDQSKKETSLNQRIIKDVSRMLDNKGVFNVAKPTVSVAFIGAVSPYSMQWLARVSGVKLSMKGMHLDPDPERFYSVATQSDFVVAAKSGTPDIWRKIPQIDEINDLLIKRLSTDKMFRQIGEYPTSNGGAIYLFENVYAPTGGFTCFANFEGFLGLEGPVKGSGAKRVRWGIWPESNVTIKSRTKGQVDLFLSLRGSGRSAQHLELLLNGSVVTVLTLEQTESFHHYYAKLAIVEGLNRLSFVYREEPPASPDGRKRAVLFSSILINDTENIIIR
jgi:hypothetical protein